MNQGIRVFIYPVKDIAQAKTLYSKLLGVEPHQDEPYYVGFMVGDQEIGLDPNGHNQGMTGPVGYWEVNDITNLCNHFWTLAPNYSKRSKMSVEVS